jgi:hypothetical protein
MLASIALFLAREAKIIPKYFTIAVAHPAKGGILGNVKEPSMAKEPQTENQTGRKNMVTREQLDKMFGYTDLYLNRMDVGIALNETPDEEVADLCAFIEWAKQNDCEDLITVTVLHDMGQFLDAAQGHPHDCASPRSQGYAAILAA